MWVKVIRSHFYGSANRAVGEVYEATNELGAALIATGKAERTAEPKRESPPAPEASKEPTAPAPRRRRFSPNKPDEVMP